MTLILSGTDGLSDVDGSAATPAIRGTDANTGIFFPAADTIAFSEGGTEAMRIDSSGNVGVGTVSPLSQSKLTVAQDGATTAGGLSVDQTNGASNRGGGIFLSRQGDNRASIESDYFNGLIFSNKSGAGSLTEKMRIDTSGNVGIGTSSPKTGLSLLKFGTQWTNNTTNSYPVPAGKTFLQVEAQASEENWFGFTGSYGATSGSANLLLQANFNNTNQQAGHYIGSQATAASSAVLTFGAMIGGSTTGGNSTKSEHMRIDSSGNLLVGTTSQFNSGKECIAFSGATHYGISIKDTVDQSSARFIGFINGSGTAIGGIDRVAATNAVQYLTSSDYRLKENIQPMTGALEKVQALNPCTYTWKEGGEIDEGFIAHELQKVFPSAVSGTKDAVDAEGNPQYQGIDTSFLVATLTAAIKELKALVDTQASTITQLQADVAALKGTA